MPQQLDLLFAQQQQQGVSNWLIGRVMRHFRTHG